MKKSIREIVIIWYKIQHTKAQTTRWSTVLVFLLVCLLSSNDAHSAQLRHTVSALPSITFFDGNPQYVDAMFSQEMEKSPEDIKKSSELMWWSQISSLFGEFKPPEREGVAADGVSLLLLHAEVPNLGTVSCEVVDINDKEDNATNGKCDILFGGVKKIEVPPYLLKPHFSYMVFARYTPPEKFGEPTKDEKEKHDSIAKRKLTIKLFWKDAQTPSAQESEIQKELVLERPPVVLVHGTFDNPKECWDYVENNTDKHWKNSPKEYKNPGLAKKLRNTGFNVYLVDYELSNGSSGPSGKPNLDEPIRYPEGVASGEYVPLPHYRSHFQDNQKVVWNGGSDTKNHPGKGIKEALEEYRKRGIAVTQADVVGHSMGGVLIRAYARGSRIKINKDDKHIPPAMAHLSEDKVRNWYYRDNNFRKGDINRIITIGSTHKGSHISNYVQAARTDNSSTNKEQFVWGAAAAWTGKFAQGAFTDQVSASPALLDLGLTPVPSHAIAAVASIADLELFKNIDGSSGSFWEKMSKVWKLTTYRQLISVFYSNLQQPYDALVFSNMLATKGELEKRLNHVREFNNIALISWALLSSLANKALSGPSFSAICYDYKITAKHQLEDISWNPPDDLSLEPYGLKPYREDEAIFNKLKQLRKIVSAINADSTFCLSVGYKSEIKRINKDIKELSEMLENEISILAKKLTLLDKLEKQRFAVAVFGNDNTDFTVSLDSQLGGLEEFSKYTTVFRPEFNSNTKQKHGILHTYEPRHIKIQEQVLELLKGGMDNFLKEGFPKSEAPKYFLPDNAKFEPYKGKY